MGEALLLAAVILFCYCKMFLKCFLLITSDCAQRYKEEQVGIHRQDKNK